jgi:hypothetical protein
MTFVSNKLKCSSSAEKRSPVQPFTLQDIPPHSTIYANGFSNVRIEPTRALFRGAATLSLG